MTIACRMCGYSGYRRRNWLTHSCLPRAVEHNVRPTNYEVQQPCQTGDKEGGSNDDQNRVETCVPCEIGSSITALSGSDA